MVSVGRSAGFVWWDGVVQRGRVEAWVAWVFGDEEAVMSLIGFPVARRGLHDGGSSRRWLELGGRGYGFGAESGKELMFWNGGHRKEIKEGFGEGLVDGSDVRPD